MRRRMTTGRTPCGSTAEEEGEQEEEREKKERRGGPSSSRSPASSSPPPMEATESLPRERELELSSQTDFCQPVFSSSLPQGQCHAPSTSWLPSCLFSLWRHSLDFLRCSSSSVFFLRVTLLLGLLVTTLLVFATFLFMKGLFLSRTQLPHTSSPDDLPFPLLFSHLHPSSSSPPPPPLVLSSSPSASSFSSPHSEARPRPHLTEAEKKQRAGEDEPRYPGENGRERESCPRNFPGADTEFADGEDRRGGGGGRALTPQSEDSSSFVSSQDARERPVPSCLSSSSSMGEGEDNEKKKETKKTRPVTSTSSSSSSWVSVHPYSQLLLILIDALRFDFAWWEPKRKPPSLPPHLASSSRFSVPSLVPRRNPSSTPAPSRDRGEANKGRKKEDMGEENKEGEERARVSSPGMGAVVSPTKDTARERRDDEGEEENLLRSLSAEHRQEPKHRAEGGGGENKGKGKVEQAAGTGGGGRVAEEEEEEEEAPPHHNNLRVLHDLLRETRENKPSSLFSTRLFVFEADAPTATTQRLKALTAGTLPTFFEVHAARKTTRTNSSCLSASQTQQQQQRKFNLRRSGDKGCPRMQSYTHTQAYLQEIIQRRYLSIYLSCIAGRAAYLRILNR